MFFTMLFWAFFEQAGSSINLFTDRNVNRVFAEETITESQVGTTVQVEVGQGLTGYTLDEQMITMGEIDKWKEEGKTTIDWPVSSDDVGMTSKGSEVATSQYQAPTPCLSCYLAGIFFSVSS